MKLSTIMHSLELYDSMLDDFAQGYQLPAELFASPDHFAIKCSNQIDYFDTLRELFPLVDAEGVWELTLDERLLASAGLADSVYMNGGRFDWIEIMQPKPGRELQHGFVEHAEFYCSDLFRVEEILGQRGVEYTFQKNTGHAWANVPIDDEGREIKFNDRPLSELVILEREQGMLNKLIIEV